jgi:hypothetical protein
VSSASTAAISNSEMVQSANAEEFRKIRALADAFVKRDVSAKAALYAALEALFHFVTNFETEADRREFVEAQGGKWGKVARENPFQPFVKLAFTGDAVSEGSRSQYAKVLRYAEFKRDKSKSLADWLKGAGGIEGLYADANGFFPSHGRHVDPERFAGAMANVRQRQQSDAFMLDKAASLGPDLDQGYVMAILHVGNDGSAHVVEYAERNQTKIDAIMEKIARGEAKDASREAKPLYPLFRAVRLLRMIVRPGLNDDDQLITLSTETAASGQSCVIVRALSNGYEGAMGEVVLTDPIAWVPSDRTVALLQSQADRLCGGFEVEGHWVCDAASEPLALSHSHETVANIELVDPLATEGYYRTRNDFQKIAPIMLLHDAAQSFLEQRNKKQPDKAYRGALRLDWIDDQLIYRPNPNWPVSHSLFTLPLDPRFGDDRMFSSDMLAALCTVACDLQTDLEGWLVSTPEEDSCAILIDQEVGDDHAYIVMPLVKTIQGHTTQTNVAAD